MIRNYSILLLLLLTSLCGITQPQFSELGGPPGGSVLQIKVNSARTILYSLSKNLLYVSTDGGTNWQVNNTFPTTGVSARDLFVDKNDKIYVLTENSVIKSSDAGTTWTTTVAGGNYQSVRKLLKNETTGTLFAIGYVASNYTLIRSTDDGANWTSCYSTTSVKDFDIKNTATFSHVYLATDGADKVIKNTNDGDPSSWTPVTASIGASPTDIVVNKTSGNIYASFHGAGVYYSTNNGTSWTAISTAGTTLDFVGTSPKWHLFASETTAEWFIFYDTDYNSGYAPRKLYRNSAANGTWTEITDLALFNSFNGFLAFSSSIFVAANETGILRSTNSGTNWLAGDNGIIGANLTSIEYVPYRDFLTATYANNRVLFSADDSSTPPFKAWTKPLTAGTMMSLVRLSNNNVLAIGSQTFEMTEGWEVYLLKGTSPGTVTLHKAHRHTDALIYALSSSSNNVVYRTTNQGTSWATYGITGLPANKEIRNISTTSDGDIYLGLRDNSTTTFKIYRVPNGSLVASQLTVSGFTEIYSIGATGTKIYVHGWQSGEKVAVSTNDGAAWTIKNASISSDMLVPTEDVLFGMNGGDVLFSSDNGDTWQTIISSSPGTLTDIVLAEGLNYKAYLSLSNGAIWESDGSVVRPNAPVNLRSVAEGSYLVYLQWDYTNGLATPDYFKAERKELGESTFVVVEDQISNYERFFQDGTAQPDKDYVYRISAYNSAGDRYSNEISVSTKSVCSPTIPDNRRWTGTVAAATPNTEINIKKLSGEAYIVSDILANSLDEPPYDIPSPKAALIYENCGTPFMNDVSDIYPDGLGTWNGTNTITIKFQHTASGSTANKTITLVLDPTDGAPDVPINLSAYSSSTSGTTLSWATGNYQQKFYIERSTTPGFTAGTVASVGSVNYPTRTIVDAGPLTVGTIYYYRVKSENFNGVQSAYSTNLSYVFSKPNFIESPTIVSSSTSNSIGSTWVDLDTDGDDDLILNEYGAAYGISKEPIMYSNNGAGNFVLTTGLAESGIYNASLAGDYNNDGRTDLLFLDHGSPTTPSAPTENKLMRNTGSLPFTRITGVPFNTSASLSLAGSWVDVNNDGGLDVFINYFSGSKLYLGNGAGGFTEDLTDPLVTDDFESLFTSPLWADYDNDGDQDVFIIDDNGINRLYQNDGAGNFINANITAFAADNDNYGSGAWGDYDNDGDLDLYITHSGEGASSGPNILYQNNGIGGFVKVATVANTPTENKTTSSFGCAWVDVDNDADLDLIVGNSFANASVYLNNGSGNFTKVSNKEFLTGGPTSYMPTSISVADYDKDGFQDIFVSNFYFSENSTTPTLSANRLLKNANSTGNWLRLHLTGTNSNTSAIGARIVLTAGGKTQIREVQSITSSFSQSSFVQHFGIGSATSITSLQIKWPSGLVQTVPVSGINQTLQIDEDSEGPTLILSPGNGVSDVSTTTTLTITTNESSSAVATKLVSVFHADETTALFTLDVSTATKSGNTYTFTLPQQLNLNSVYRVSIDAGAFTDVYGNASLAVAKESWTFTTTNGPTISTYSPAFLATNVNTTTSLAITFNQPVTPVAAKALKVFDTTAPTTAVATLAVDAAAVSGNTFTFTLPTKLNLQKEYFITIDVGAFKDADQNDYAGLAASTWQFTTTAGPLVSALLPANGATDVLVTRDLEVTFDKAITAVAGKMLRVLDGTDPVAEVAVATTGSIAGNTYTLPHVAPFPGDTQLTITIEAGAFVDAAGNDFAGITGLSWQFTTEDKTAPIIAFTPPTSLTKGFATAAFGATVTDNREVSLVRVHHRKITDASFITVTLTESGTIADLYNASVSEAMLDAIGIEYFFTARDANNNEARSPAGTATYKTRLNYTAETTKIPTLGFGGEKTSWKVFAIPFDLGSNNSVTTIFDELASLKNKEDYRIIKYKDETNWGEYPTDFSNITRGEGYFINIKEALDVAVGDNLVAPANDRNNLFTINLKQGWNQIGNPYLTQISWSDVAAFNGLTGTAATLKKFLNGTYSNQNDLAPFEGGFVFVDAAVNNVSIPFLGQTSSGARTNPSMMWELPLHVSQGEIRNEFGGIGMAKQAAISFDDFDDVNPPRFGDFVEINFQHPEHFARFFAKDVVPVAEEHVWNFNIKAGQEGSTTLSWSKEIAETLPGELYLTNDKMLFPIDMRKVNSYVVPSGAKASSFKIYYGKSIGNELMPFTAVADAAYPNPTNGVLTIPLALPAKGGEQQRVRVELLNTVGSSVGVPLEGVYSSGFHEVQLDAGTGMSTDGLVLYKISVENTQGSTVLQGKVMVKK